MGGLFGGGSPHAPAMPPAPPTLDKSQALLDQEARWEAQRLQRGSAAVLLTGGQGLSNPGTTSNMLLGR